MVNYEFIKSIEHNQFLEMVRRGVVPISIMDYLTVYEFFLNELKSTSKSVAITTTADKYNCSEKTIYNVINFMIR
jgi:hypothetical protein